MAHHHFMLIWMLIAISTVLVPISDASLAAMSIDFGSQFIKMALVKPGVPMEMVLNEEARRKTPNLITIKDKERLFGDAALAYSVKHPKNSFTHLVDLLGKKIDNPVVSLFKQRFPYSKIVPDDARDVVLFEVDGENYNVETFIAMILSQCRKVAERFAKQPVHDVVITVPAFFNQAERRALVTAAEIAGLNLLQLLNDHTAAGLSYGAFRRKEITEKAQTLLIYDVGAAKVTASVLEYVLVPEKKGSEKNPVMTTLGIGYDRTIGGFEITQRLRDIFVNDFRQKQKTKDDITKNPRAMAKMLREAERVKIILSANVNFTAQVESVHDEKDFVMSVTRKQLEEAISDLEPKFIQPIIDALKLAELSPEQIDQVVLMGAGTRVPRLQELIQKFFKGKELGKFLNTDEAIAMGAVYQAAHLSKGFKVKKFVIRDLQIFPLEVDFMSALSKEDTSPGRLIRRPIYGFKSFVPASGKVLSFTSFTKDFFISVNYGEMKHLSVEQLSQFGVFNISEIQIQGVTDAYASEASKKDTVFKGIKAHFTLDDSGILHADGAEMLLERPPKAESAFASLAGKITGLFSSNSKTDETKEKKDEDAKDEEIPTDKIRDKTSNVTEDVTKSKHSATDKASNASDSAAGTNNTMANATDSKKEEKPRQVKIPLKLKEKKLDVATLSDSEVAAAKNRLAEYERKEREKQIREEAQHDLESLAVDLGDKLTQKEFQKFLTDGERTSLEKEVLRVKAWLEEDVSDATAMDEFIENKKMIDDLLKPVKVRITEDQERPLVVAELMSMFNHTEIFLTLGKNLTESEVFTEVEISTLSKLLSETKDWLAEKVKLQSELQPTDPPVFSVSEAKEKLLSLDREVKYLLNKMKFVRPKVLKKDEKTNETTAEGNDTMAEAATESEPVLVEEKPDEDKQDEPSQTTPATVEEKDEKRTLHDDSEL